MSWLSKTVKKVGKAFTGIPEVITQVGSDLLTNVFNSKAQKEQQAFDLKMWNLQNEYNTPANQVARLRAAGLNPNLFYGQGNVGNATSAPTTEAVRYNFDFAKAFDKMALVEQMKNMREQNKNLQAQNNNLNATTDSIKLENELKRRDLELYQKYGIVPRGGLPQQVIKYGKDMYDWVRSGDAFDFLMRQFIDKNYGVEKQKLKYEQSRNYFNYPRR